MLPQVKEFFNKLKKTQKKEKIPKKVMRRHRTGIQPCIDYDIPDVTNFSHFIECEIAPNICPMMWESMEVDYEDENRRYCEYCQKYIYKADNEYMIKKLSSENKCMAVSSYVLEKMHGKMDEKRYVNLQTRLTISKLFMYCKRFNPVEFKQMQERGLTYKEQLKEILLLALDQRDLEKYIKMEVEVAQIYSLALEYGDDEEFNRMILDRIKNY